MHEVEGPLVLQTDIQFFFGKFVLARNWVKRPRIAQFVHKFVNTAFFSKLANKFFFNILHEAEGP